MWCAGTRGDTCLAAPFQRLAVMHVPKGMCLVDDKGRRVAARRAARLAERLWAATNVSCWSDAVAGMWWRCAFRTPRCVRLANRTSRWISAWWRKTLEAILAGAGDPTHQRLDRRRPGLGKRRWDDMTQKMVDTIRGQRPWHEEASGADASFILVTKFVRRVVRRGGHAMPPWRRCRQGHVSMSWVLHPCSLPRNSPMSEAVYTQNSRVVAEYPGRGVLRGPADDAATFRSGSFRHVLGAVLEEGRAAPDRRPRGGARVAPERRPSSARVGHQVARERRESGA